MGRCGGPFPLTPKLTVRKPHAYQKRGVEWLLSHGGAGLFADPGSGKTGIVLRALLALKQSKVGRRTLVVTTKRIAREVWPAEPVEWAGSAWDGVNDLKVVVLHGDHKDDLLTEPADIYVVNFDGLPWLAPHLLKLGCDTLVIDESSKIKNSSTRRFKILKPFLTSFKRRWILTGSPNPNGYLDLFGQIYIIDLGLALGKYVTHYRFNYFYQTGYGGYTWALKPGADKEITEAVRPYIFRLETGDYVKLPKVVPNVVRVELPPEARRVYDELEEDLITRLSSGRRVIAVSAGAAAIKCAQVANGGLYHHDEVLGAAPSTPKERLLALVPQTAPRTWTNIHEAKIEAVQEIVEGLQGKPVMIVYDFLHDLDRLEKAFGKCPVMGGRTTEKEFAAIYRDWNLGRVPILFVHYQSVSHGLNMQKSGNHIILHSLTHNYDDYDQLIRRISRQGAKFSQVFVHHIVARGTVDEAKMRNLKKKGKTQGDFLEALKEYVSDKKQSE